MASLLVKEPIYQQLNHHLRLVIGSGESPVGSQFLTERQICEIVWPLTSGHVYNLTNIGLNIHSDMLCDISRKK